MPRFGSYKCPHCPDSQLFNTQTGYFEHEKLHIDIVKAGGSWKDTPTGLIAAKPDGRFYSYY